jgi:hypothetical protein
VALLEDEEVRTRNEREDADIVFKMPSFESRDPSALISSISCSALQTASVTPMSAIENTTREHDRTPAHRHFSEGDRDRPIMGLHPKDHQSDDDAVSLTTRISAQGRVRGTFIPSTRPKRVAEDLESHGELLLPLSPSFSHNVDILQGLDDVSPTTSTSYGRPSTEELQSLHCAGGSSTQIAVFDCSGSASEKARKTNTTLTERSSRSAHDRAEVTIDTQPFELYWDEYSIDPSGKSLDGVDYLKEFLPKLDLLTL